MLVGEATIGECLDVTDVVRDPANMSKHQVQDRRLVTCSPVYAWTLEDGPAQGAAVLRASAWRRLLGLAGEIYEQGGLRETSADTGATGGSHVQIHSHRYVVFEPPHRHSHDLQKLSKKLVPRQEGCNQPLV